MKSGDFSERWDGASVIRWDAGAWVANEECEVELLQYFCRDDGRIVGVSLGVVRIWCLMGTIRTVDDRFGCPNSTLDPR